MPETFTEDTREKLGKIAGELHDIRFPLMFMARAVGDQLESPMDDGYEELMDRLIEDLARLSDAVYSIYEEAKPKEDQPS